MSRPAQPNGPDHPDAAAPADEALAARLASSRQLLDAPEAVIQRAIDLFVARQPQPAAPAGGLRRLLAQLVFDTAGRSGLAFGLRAEGEAEVRQILFSAEGRDIDLRLIALDDDGQAWRVSGQVLGPDRGGEAEIRLPGGDRSAVPWNDLAEFSFGRIDAPSCRLTLRSPDWEVELPEIEFARRLA